jgi:hypothetical protein
VHGYEKPPGTEVPGKTQISSRKKQVLKFRAGIAKISIYLTLNRSANLVFLKKKVFEQNLKFTKNWTFCVLDVFYPGHSVTGRLANGCYVSWKFCGCAIQSTGHVC